MDVGVYSNKIVRFCIHIEVFDFKFFLKSCIRCQKNSIELILFIKMVSDSKRYIETLCKKNLLC